jgi:hypothetical protein
MNRKYVAAALAAGVVTASAPMVRADVKTDERAQVRFEGLLGKMAGLFGGRAAREGVKTTIAVRGDRKVSLTDQTGQIVDLKEEKIYDLDLRRKTYKVTTFAELRRQMEKAQRKAAEDMKKAQAEAKSQPAPGSGGAAAQDGKQMDVDFDLKETGQKKTINGFDAHQIVMTITMREKGKTLEQSGGMVLTSDIWMTPAIKAMKEVTDFDLRYAKALAGPMIAGASPDQMAAAMAMYPMMKDAIARMRAENVKMDGTPVQTTTTIDAVQSAEQLAAAQQQQQEQQQNSGASSGGVGGLLGGLGRRMANRGNSNNNTQQAPGRATFMTITSEILSVATTVADADLSIPAGFKEGR